MSFYPFTAVVLVLFALLSTEYSNGQVASNNESSVALKIVARTPNAGIPGSWISDLFYQALANFTVRHVGSTECRKQSEIYDNSLRNYTSWAVRSEYFIILYYYYIYYIILSVILCVVDHNDY